PAITTQESDCRGVEKRSAARRRTKAAREAYFLYVERAAEGANEADGPLSASRAAEGANEADGPLAASRALQEAAESAAVVEQRLATMVAARVEGFDLADEDRVIAAGI